MPDWLYDVDTSTMVIIVSAFFVTATWLGTLFIRPFVRTFVRRQPGANDLVAYLLGAHGVYFGILLGLLSVEAYGNFTSAENLVEEEASELASLYRDSSAYPPPIRDELTKILREYARFIIEDAWPQQQKGILPKEGVGFINRYQDTLMSFEPKTKAQEILHAETLRSFNSMVKARRERIDAIESEIPAILWYVVYLGAGVNLLLIWLLDMRLVTQLFLGGIITFFLAALIALVGAMDKPFRGEVSVSSDPYKDVYEQLMKPPLRPSVIPTTSTP
jgi:hypothetical protein